MEPRLKSSLVKLITFPVTRLYNYFLFEHYANFMPLDWPAVLVGRLNTWIVSFWNIRIGFVSCTEKVGLARMSVSVLTLKAIPNKCGGQKPVISFRHIWVY